MPTKEQIKERGAQWMRHYRPELIACAILLLSIIPLLLPGHITYSDLAIGRVADEYLNYVVGVFNEQLGTPNWFNLPRLTWIAIPYLIGKIFGNSGHLFLASLIYLIFVVTTFSFGSLFRRLVQDSKHPLSEIGLIVGAIVYAINPWVMVRIQHIFILCGYALVPLAISYYWGLLGEESWGRNSFHVPLTMREWRKFLLLGCIVSASFAGIHFGIFIILCMVAMVGILAPKALWVAFKQRCLPEWFVWYALRGVLTGGTFILFAAYWIMPFVMSIVGGIRPSQNNVNAIETVVNFSRAVTPSNLLLGISYWWPQFDHTLLPNTFEYGGFAIMSVGLIGILYSRRIVLAVLSAGVLFIASGTYLPSFAATYISMVFDTMYPFGDMIRDPNKLYGVFILPAAVFIAYGFTALEVALKKVLSLKKSLLLISTVSAVGLLFWLSPTYNIFFLGYYTPVEWPDPYNNLQAQLESLPEPHKVLYLPVSDFVTHPDINVASPEFNNGTIQGLNRPKATGDHMCFDTREDTLFPFEGNDMMVMYFLKYLHHQMDHHNINDVGGLVSKAGITHIVLRRDYPYAQERLDEYKNILDSQTDLELVWEEEFMALYAVKPAQGDGQYFKNLTYTTGGLERMQWLPRYFETATQNVNLLFAYDGHEPAIEHLKPGEIVEITSTADLWMTQLSTDDFVYPADPLRNVTPHSSWAKLILTGHDWEHTSNHYKLANHKSQFDMGRGLAFTLSPTQVPHKALAPPENGIPLLTEQLSTPATFLRPFEHFAIETQVTDEQATEFKVLVPGSVPITEWQMLDTPHFPMKELQLYYITVQKNKIEEDDVQLEFRVGFYSAEGNRLDTTYAYTPNTIPPKEIQELSQTFLTPKGTATATLEIRVLNPTQTDIEIQFSDLSLFALENFATPNTLTFDLPEKDYSEEGYLWIRYLCSPKGGVVHFTTDNFDQELDTRCGPVSRLEWVAYPTAKELAPTVQMTNKTGINAINALTWLSKSEMVTLQQTTSAKIQDKTLMHIVDSVDMDGSHLVESENVHTQLMGGTMKHGVNGTLHSTFDIAKESTYQLDILDYLPNDGDQYTVELYARTSPDTPIITTTVTADDSRRTLREGTLNHFAKSTIPTIPLSPGLYDVYVKVQGTSRLLIDWDDLDNKDVPECIEMNKSERYTDRLLPMWEKNWGSLNSKVIPYNQQDSLMLWFEYAVVECRSLHGKLKFLNAQKEELGVIYLSDTANGGVDLTAYEEFTTPPEGTEYIQVQFMAQHQEIFSEQAKYVIGGFQLWSESSSIGIDALILLEQQSTQDWSLAETWQADTNTTPVAIESTRGKRTIQLDTASANRRIQFFESPIHHWIFESSTQRLKAFAVNGLSFGLDVPENVDTVQARIALNRTWNRGVIIMLMGFLIMIGLTVRIEQKRDS